MIQVMGYCLKEDYSLYDPLFRSVVKSMSMEPALAYKPRWSDSLPPEVSGIDWGGAVTKGIAVSIFFAAVGLLVGLIKKFKRRSDDQHLS